MLSPLRLQKIFMKSGALAFFNQKARPLALYGGAAVVALWTFIRHISNGVNFDVVGQIGLADQWARGVHSGAVLGQTNYVLKMPLYALFNSLRFVSPMNRLLALALIFNVATFVLIFILLEKMLNLYSQKSRSWLYVSMAWLATISASVYWLDYANSRNLETVGGMLFVYLVMKYLQAGKRSMIGYLALAGSVIFFADSLQLFVCGGGTCLYVVGRWLLKRTRHHLGQMVALVGAVLGSYVGAKILSLLSKHLLAVTYLAVPNSPHPLTLANAVNSVRGLAISLIKVFDGDFLKPPYGPNSIRELLNFVVLAGIIVVIVKLLLSRHKHRYPAGLLLSIVLANCLVYIASGQALQANTSRYLIMVPLVVIALVALTAPQIVLNRRRLVQQVWLGVIIVSSLLVLGALVNSWPARHAKDQHIYDAVAFLQQNDFKYALASDELGVTGTYFAQGQAVVLPVSCEANNTVQAIDLFYDKGAFNLLHGYSKEVPIILQSDGQQLRPTTCDKTHIIAAFGQPLREQSIPGVGVAEIYNASSVKVAAPGQSQHQVAPQ